MIEMHERGQWSGFGHLLLIGPGGAGKTTLGGNIAPLLGLPMVDLDQEFIREYGNIDAFIRSQGYDQYRSTNSALVEKVTSSPYSVLLVTSSGFVTSDNPKVALAANLRVLAASYSVCLLPSRHLETSVAIIVTRQLQRPFSRGRCREEEVARARIPAYAEAGDLTVFSDSGPGHVAQAVASRLLRMAQ